MTGCFINDLGRKRVTAVQIAAVAFLIYSAGPEPHSGLIYLCWSALLLFIYAQLRQWLVITVVFCGV